MKRKIVISAFVIIVTFALIFAAKFGNTIDAKDVKITDEMSLMQISKAHGIPLKKILHIMSHEDSSVWELPKDKPVKEFDVTIKEINHAIEHVKEDDKPVVEIIKFLSWAILLSVVMFFILTRKKIKRIRWIAMLCVILIFGVLLGASPNPMESIVKFIKLLNSMEANPGLVVISLIIFTIFSLIGAKFICSWGCHFGAVQETIFNIPLLKKKKRQFKVPFILSLISRLVFFGVLIVLIFSMNFVITHHVNFFKIFNISDIAVFAVYMLPIILLASLFIYRPFCQFFCPFSLFSWLFQDLALNKIHVDEEKCIDCKLCVKDCPTEAMDYILHKKRKCFLPDCWSCGNCIDVCPKNAVYWGTKKDK